MSSFVLALGLFACATPRQSYTEQYNQCTEQKDAGLFGSEKDFALCLNQALTIYGPSMDYEYDNIQSYNSARLAVAEKVDAKKISEKEAEKQYGTASKKFTDSHKAYFARRTEQERAQNEIMRRNHEQFMARQRLVEQHQRYAHDCIERYEASMPKEYNTNCYGGASPDGRNVVGYQNCTTSERRQSAPRHIVDRCYEEAKHAIPLY